MVSHVVLPVINWTTSLVLDDLLVTRVWWRNYTCFSGRHRIDPHLLVVDLLGVCSIHASVQTQIVVVTFSRRISSAKPLVVNSPHNAWYALDKLIYFDILWQNLEEILAHIALACSLDKTWSWVLPISYLGQLFNIHITIVWVSFRSFTFSQSLHLLSIHVLGWVILDDTQDAWQVHEFERLGCSDIYLASPVSQTLAFAKVGQMEDVHLLFDRLYLSCLL